jgi:hypothetical protein
VDKTQPSTWSDMAQRLNMVFTFLDVWEKKSKEE